MSQKYEIDSIMRKKVNTGSQEGKSANSKIFRSQPVNHPILYTNSVLNLGLIGRNQKNAKMSHLISST